MKKTILLALFALCSSVMFAQTTVTGTVTAADDGSTIAYANVQEEGTTNLVFTDDNGKFSINILQSRETHSLSNLHVIACCSNLFLKKS